MLHKNGALFFVVSLAILLVAGCAPAQSNPPAGATFTPQAPLAARAPSSCSLRLATTTSTADSGLLDFILPDFQKQYNCRVDIVAVGTGQALQIGSKGDADVVLVHARAQEDKFVADGQAQERFDVMYNDFVIVGPKADPARVSSSANAVAAFQAIAQVQAPFASRGDQSGTNTKELGIWASAHITRTTQLPWYLSLGQGMGETLTFANEKPAYTLTDRGTYLSQQSKLPNLAILLGGSTLQENKDKTLLNPYGVMAVNPDKHPGVDFAMAMNFVRWITSPDTQKLIGSFGVDRFGQSLFHPSAAIAP